MSKTTLLKLALASIIIIAIGLLVYQVPAVKSRLNWRMDVAATYIRNVINPVGQMPTPLPQPVAAVTLMPTPSPTVAATEITVATPSPGPPATQAATATAIPQAVNLGSPSWEKQTPNNCGPATLSLYLRSHNWQGNQSDISALLKPETGDRNVNVEELVYYVRTQVGWLNAEYRVGGDIELMKKFLAAGLPVMIEEGDYLDEQYWPNDDRWAGHYLLLTGYDDPTQTFIAQDTFRSSDRNVAYESIAENWQEFNYVYILVFRPDQTELVKSILGEDWDPDTNRENALELAQSQTVQDPNNAFTWFNLGSNLVYFERFNEAAQAYDTAREVGLPQRMLRYQFGPFFAYFFSGRNDDLLSITEYALQRTPNSEETLLWRGWGKYRAGDTSGAIEDFRSALVENPYYQDAEYALDFVTTNP
ncbi:MAG: C39 family peptidase [Chloroflexota bacterium]|nr:MAG: C39 family peptidase [Chloroflexota bacterium]